jgi:hypothetical protein
MQKIELKKYLSVFIITVAIFTGALLLSNYFNNRRLANIRSITDSISIDILSSETQFSLLSEVSCKDIDTTILSQELNSLAEKITYSEQNLTDIDQLTYLKKYYSLLEIKDYLLMQKAQERCDLDPVSILYFYSTKEKCPACETQGYILSALRDKYPQLRVYSFDYNLDLSAIRTMIALYKVPPELPIVVINGKPYKAFENLEQLESFLPELKTIATTTATTTKTTR